MSKVYNAEVIEEPDHKNGYNLVVKSNEPIIVKTRGKTFKNHIVRPMFWQSYPKGTKGTLCWCRAANMCGYAFTANTKNTK